MADNVQEALDPAVVQLSREKLLRLFIPPITEPRARTPEFSGSDQGWPPKTVDVTDVREVQFRSMGDHLNDDLEERLRRAALRNPQVRDAVGERFGYIDTDETEPLKVRKGERPSGTHTRLSFFSHSRNVEVEVEMRGFLVVRVSDKEGGEPPEGEDEIRAAVGIAKRDPRLQAEVRDLAAAAILATVNDDHPAARHRLLHVTFRRPGAYMPLHNALVDLTEEQVITVHSR